MVSKPPKEGVTDKALKVLKTAIEQIPYYGPAVTTAFSLFLTSPYQKRVDQWQQEMSDSLEQLQNNKGVDLDDLKNNQEFIDILLQAFQIGLRNHQEEKREALKNAIINSALTQTLDFAKQQIFLNYIDIFTEWHLKLLTLLENPREWFIKNNKHSPAATTKLWLPIDEVIGAAYPQLANQRSLLNLIWTDLFHRQLLNISRESLVSASMLPNEAMATRTTKLGNDLIRFISA